MNKENLRLRMFAGPNGSGKSTFKSILSPDLVGIFINPDAGDKQPGTIGDNYKSKMTRRIAAAMAVGSPACSDRPIGPMRNVGLDVTKKLHSSRGSDGSESLLRVFLPSLPRFG